MADKNDSRPKKQLSKFNSLDVAAKKLLSLIDSNYIESHSITKRDYAIQKIINRELELMSGVSEGNIIDFIMSMDKRADGFVGDTENDKSAMFDNIFIENMGDIFTFYQESYKNKFLEMADLKMISKFVPSMGKVISILLSSIVNSDDVSDTLIRNIEFPTGTSDDSKKAIMKEIETLEKDLKLKKKLKNTVFKRTLVAGKYYIYNVPYKKIFDEFDKLIENGVYQRNPDGTVSTKNFGRKGGFKTNAIKHVQKGKTNPGFESYDFGLESVMEAFPTSQWDEGERDAISKALENNNGGEFFVYSETDVLYEALESFVARNSYDNAFNGEATVLKTQVTSDATLDTGKKKSKKKKTGEVASDYEEIKGEYIKYIDAKYLIPCIIFDTKVGYFYIRPTPGANNSVMTPRYNTGGKASLLATSAIGENKKDRALSTIASKISEGIIGSFGTKFIQDNLQYKSMIAECLISNGFANNDYHVQFIPAEDIIEYTVNEDENGEGESVLANALYPARLLFDLITAKLLNYFNKSGNKTFAHIHKGPIGTNADDQIQRVLRMLQEMNINFNDLLSTNQIFGKFTRDSNIQLPTSKNGSKIVEFETQEGQEIDLNTPMEELLNKMAIQGTPVPASFMENIDNTQFSRQIVSDHIQLAGVVSDLQAELEEPTTELYRRLIESSSLSDELKRIGANIEFKLPRPKALQNVNSAEFVDNAFRLAESIAKLYYGDSPQQDDVSAREKFMKSVCKQQVPYLNWDELDDLFKQSKMDAVKEEDYTKKTDNGGF